MTDDAARAVMEHATRFCRMKPKGRLRTYMILHGEGMTPDAIAAKYEVTPNLVRAYLSRGWRRIAAHHWTEWEQRELAEVANRILHPELREYTTCAMIVEAAKGRRQFRDQAPDLDENGREVASRGPLVTAHDLLRWLRYKALRVAEGEPVRPLF